MGKPVENTAFLLLALLGMLSNKQVCNQSSIKDTQRATFTIIAAYRTIFYLEPKSPIKTAAPGAYWLLNSDPGPRLSVVLTWFP